MVRQCDQIGLFLKGLVTIFLAKVSQISGDFEHFETYNYISNTAVATFGQLFEKNWATLDSII